MNSKHVTNAGIPGFVLVYVRLQEWKQPNPVFVRHYHSDGEVWCDGITERRGGGVMMRCCTSVAWLENWDCYGITSSSYDDTASPRWHENCLTWWAHVRTSRHNLFGLWRNVRRTWNAHTYVYHTDGCESGIH